MCRAVNIIFGDKLFKASQKGGSEIGHWYLSPLLSAPRCQESMTVRLDHRIAQQICAGSTNPGPGRPGDRVTTPSSYLTTPPTPVRNLAGHYKKGDFAN